jgi:hypothetical protein
LHPARMMIAPDSKMDMNQTPARSFIIGIFVIRNPVFVTQCRAFPHAV